MQPLRRLPYTCKHCASTARDTKHTRTLSSYRQLVTRRSYSNVTKTSRPFRLAVIGSGPAGFYAAYRFMNKVQDAIVDMYEQLPVPFGLVRFGVAPDHPEVKNCQDKFEEVALSPRFNFIGNVAVGHDIPLSLLTPHYDAILFAYGASEDKALGIPGEQGNGIYSARAFVGWYNGLPEYAGLSPALTGGEEAIVIGQGNVALDVARILLSPVEDLQKTDITTYAADALRRSTIKKVSIVGRRGPFQAAFTVKEARELINLQSAQFLSDGLRKAIQWDALPSGGPKKLPRVQRRLFEVLMKGMDEGLKANTSKYWELRYFLSPERFDLDAEGELDSITFSQNMYSDGSDPLSVDAKVATSSEHPITLPSSVAFRSVGYKSASIPGLEDLGITFDSRMGIIPNDIHGRVLSPTAGPGSLTAGHVPGMYCAGWVKRGPTGVIASTMDDAFSSADVIASDWENRAPFLNHNIGNGQSTALGWDGVKDEAARRGLQRVSWQDWKKIDQVEKEKGKLLGKEREKFASVEDMLRVLNS
ncbi:NADPH-adrenodoxin reductase Arh1 [Pseudovirgaria hyperparasitica]|uniref:NADPH:adrenodoxin oxidoreductase, mitochondrial n=1 Tax=Pseudovirgaria hyperparasitica TaxID=470096 RepID=A0A6A6WH72_9PEZI|nr:NADPH-adrenodoxin reductase Arh1 [Pseudovirgaria hyperparasitica]KAF2760501.1 NADPH-adrenodoxin reductase Arh1 [Pseudovirgaria hyperparasitica]